MPPNAKVEEEEIEKQKGRVLTNFSFIEYVISLMILKHYIKDTELAEQIRNDIFDNENFSFYLKFNLFKNMLATYYSEQVKELNYNPDKINRLITIRNRLAHSGLKAQIQTVGDQHSYGELLFTHGGKLYKPQDVFDEYAKLSAVVQPELQNLATRLSLIEFTDTIRSEDLRKIPPEM